MVFEMTLFVDEPSPEKYVNSTKPLVKIIDLIN
jgi:hypothetical protein